MSGDDNVAKRPEVRLAISKSRMKKVKCIEQDIVYDSLSEAMQLTGINRRYISEACNGIRDLAGGYHWEWANKEVKVDME